jgi:hypothetical protein
MNNRPSWDSLPATTPEEKIKTLGIAPGLLVDIRTLGTISNQYSVSVYLFFEKDLAHNRSLETVLEDYRAVSEFERPFIRVDRFLEFTRENDPSFEQTMQEFPLMVEIVRIDESLPDKDGKRTPCITGLMPFLDELNVDDDPAAPPS